FSCPHTRGSLGERGFPRREFSPKAGVQPVQATQQSPGPDHQNIGACFTLGLLTQIRQTPGDQKTLCRPRKPGNRARFQTETLPDLHKTGLRTWTATDIIHGADRAENHFGIGRLRRFTKRKERTLDLQRIVSELKAERDRLNWAIEALDGETSSGVTKRSAGSAPRSGRRRGGITPEGRRRLSLAMKKRWAERRKKSS